MITLKAFQADKLAIKPGRKSALIGRIAKREDFIIDQTHSVREKSVHFMRWEGEIAARRK